jgi:hypothetical protein
MKKQHILLSCLLVFICSTATAQFNKALPNMRGNGQVNDAKVNVGLLGGGNLTHWQHFNSAQASDWYLAAYKPKLRFGYFGGIAVEYMWKSDLSFGLNVIYEQHNVGLNYLNESFPTAFNYHITRNYDFTAAYNSIEAYIPVTYYISTGYKNLKPYFFLAPRFSYILGGTMEYIRTDIDGQNITQQPPITAEFSEITYASYYGPFTLFGKDYEIDLGMLNIGLMAGVGTQFRFNTSNYYFLLKLDLSANVNGFQTFTKYALMNEFNHLRYSADAHLTATFMLPIKKRLIGACIRWGEYD